LERDGGARSEAGGDGYGDCAAGMARVAGAWGLEGEALGAASEELLCVRSNKERTLVLGAARASTAARASLRERVHLHSHPLPWSHLETIRGDRALPRARACFVRLRAGLRTCVWAVSHPLLT
jgi:hypothetical protein